MFLKIHKTVHKLAFMAFIMYILGYKMYKLKNKTALILFKIISSFEQSCQYSASSLVQFPKLPNHCELQYIVYPIFMSLQSLAKCISAGISQQSCTKNAYQSLRHLQYKIFLDYYQSLHTVRIILISFKQIVCISVADPDPFGYGLFGSPGSGSGKIPDPYLDFFIRPL